MKVRHVSGAQQRPGKWCDWKGRTPELEHQGRTEIVALIGFVETDFLLALCPALPRVALPPGCWRVAPECSRSV